MRVRSLLVFIVLQWFVLSLVACSGDDQIEDIVQVTPTPTPSSSPTPTPSPTPTLAPIALGVSTSKGFTSVNSTTTDPITTQASTNLLVFVAKQDVNANTLTDSYANTFTLIESTTVTIGGVYTDKYYAYASLNATGGTNHTFTFAADSGYASVFVVEVLSSASLSIGQKRSSSSAQSGPVLNSGAVTTTYQRSLLLGFAFPGEVLPASGYTWSNSFNVINSITDSSYWCASTSYRSVTPGTYDATMSTTPDASEGGAMVIEIY